jgi:RNA-directed DNA polymerase
MQMTAKAGAPSAKLDDWEQIDWPIVEQYVQRLQTRIAKAIKERRFGKVKSLQRLLKN